MGRKKKLEHFIENATFPHLLQPVYEEIENGYFLRGKWKQDFFQHVNPLVLELGCGKGEYTVGLAAKYPEKNFIGIDRKGARMWKGAKDSLEEDMPNVGFLRVNIDLLAHIFGPEEVDEIWITFPDPQPKPKMEKKRLTSMRYIGMYRSFLKKNGRIHLKTDNFPLYEFTLKIISRNQLKLEYATDDLYNSDWLGEARDIQTFYENKFLEEGVKINYLVFQT